MTDTDLARQLVAYVDATTEPVANPAIRRNGQSTRRTPTGMETIMLTEEHTEETPTHRPVRWLMLAAAAVAAIVVGFVITSGGSDEEPAPADQPAPTPTVTTAEDDDSGGQSPELTANAAIGDEFMAALSALDAVAALELVSAAAPGEFRIAAGPTIDFLGLECSDLETFTGACRDDLKSSFKWLRASDYRFEPETCRAFDASQVACMLTQTNTWSDANGADPVPAFITLTVESGKITQLGYQPDTTWHTVAFQPFYDYIRRHHPDDVESMFVLDAGMPDTPIVNTRSINKFEQYSEEYQVAVAADS